MSPLRTVVPLVAAGLLLSAGIVVAVVLNEPVPSARPRVTPAVGATELTATPRSSPTAAPTTSPSGSPSRASDAAARRALTDCRSRVRAGDAVLSAARTGVGHWATHVQAQTDADRDKITVAQMNGRFKATRLAGPADQRRYADALAAYHARDGSCAAVKGADHAVAGKLSSCAERSRAQQPVLRAAAPAMADWKSHLAAMQRNREHHVDNAQGIWVAAWRAAPPHIKAYRKAATTFHAPAC